MDSIRRRALRALFLIAAVAAPAAAQEPTLIRLRDAVGDTIDAAERDSFRLFPKTARFHHAFILALPGPEFFAKVVLEGTDTTAQVFYRILPGQLERIRFLVDNQRYMTGQMKTDPYAEQAFASFWEAIESHPLVRIGGPAAAPCEYAAAGNTGNIERRFHLALLGTTCGSCIGGLIGANAGYTLIRPGYYEQTECGAVWVPPLYRVNVPVVLAASVGTSALGGMAGYAIGKGDRAPAPAVFPGEKKSWRYVCLGIGVLPAAALGFLVAAAASENLWGLEEHGYTLENDRDGLAVIPSVLTGVCVSVELATVAYQIGRGIDRNNAQKAAARKLPLRR
jgi:hypothetical protein